MNLVLTEGPSIEPLLLSDTKRYLKVDEDEDDTLITSLICAARSHVERSLGKALITQKWSLFFDQWPVEPVIPVPISPVQLVAAIVVYDEEGQAYSVPEDTYQVDTNSDPGRIVVNLGIQAPTPGLSVNGIEIKLVAGYGSLSSDVPHPIRQALLLLTAHWYERRELVFLGSPVVYIPEMVASLLGPYRRLRI